MGLNTFVVIMMYFVILYGRHFSFTLRNNIMILVQIPITVGVILVTKYLPDEQARFIAFLVMLLILGSFNSINIGSVYG